MEKEAVSVKVDLTSDDVYKFFKSYIINGVSMIYLAIILFAISFQIVIHMMVIIKGDYSEQNIFNLFLLIVIPLIIFFVVSISLKKSAANTLKTNKLIQKTQEYTISDEGFNAHSESAQVFVKWNEMYKATETKENYLFFIAKGQAYIIPKRYLIDEKDIEIIRKAIKLAPVQKGKNNFIKGLLIYLLIFIIILLVITFYKPV